MTADSDMMMHGAVTHVVDIGGRFAAKFHGMDFKNVNLILYVSELINNAQHRRREPNWWDRLTGVFQWVSSRLASGCPRQTEFP
ncbi:MAG: hypothetical protein WA822_00600 [Albidovulum sp.]|nr:hypothetical protein [Paroceanicella profunda]